jgi:hypothetical protein
MLPLRTAGAPPCEAVREGEKLSLIAGSVRAIEIGFRRSGVGVPLVPLPPKTDKLALRPAAVDVAVYEPPWAAAATPAR